MRDEVVIKVLAGVNQDEDSGCPFELDVHAASVLFVEEIDSRGCSGTVHLKLLNLLVRINVVKVHTTLSGLMLQMLDQSVSDLFRENDYHFVDATRSQGKFLF